ncbi:MAG TPA: phosphocholine cytidylyltransferase family protein [Caulobacteraceae bacterium]|nr:phosphocholine cytidylyltransferase family protein [Caulobacteraceae bacterium]
MAIILAAGYGRRLSDGHDGPKVLLEFDGVSLLERRLKTLEAAGIGAAAITIGHEGERLRRAVERMRPGIPVSYIENPRYREGSLLSLLVQRAALESGRPVLVMDGDVLHDDRMIERLLDGEGEVVLLVDPELEPGDEPVKVCFRGDAIVDFRKKPEFAHDRHGESVGFFRFSPAMAARLAAQCQALADAGGGMLEYEEAIRDLILEDPTRFTAQDVGDLPWTEIDFPEDVVRAREIILPQLAATTG